MAEIEKTKRAIFILVFLKLELLMAKSSCQFLHGRELTAKSKSAAEQQSKNIHMNGLPLTQISSTSLSCQRSLTFVPEQ